LFYGSKETDKSCVSTVSWFLRIWQKLAQEIGKNWLVPNLQKADS
jgi:hypothetical protein